MGLDGSPRILAAQGGAGDSTYATSSIEDNKFSAPIEIDLEEDAR